MDYKYSLSKTTTLRCPRCGRLRFKPYVDADGEILNPAVGRCNRQFNCGYHLPPRQFFRENPLEGLRHQSAPLRLPQPERRRRAATVRPLDFIPDELVARCHASRPDEVNPLR